MKTKPNKLINEKSLYLLQHAYNPVEWYPWGEEAFQKALIEDKPVFLSIGYSSCHWCHVMEKESFEDENIAKILNENFVSIKVDREELPDIDNYYMSFVQATTGSGGWPLNVFLLPDKTPFFGGTYFPPQPKYGRPSFMQVLLTIADHYKNKRNEIFEMKAKILSYLKSRFERSVEIIDVDFESIKATFEMILSAYDWNTGGFGNAPKFPMFPVLNFCTDYFYGFEDERAINLVEHNLNKILCGGIYDQVGGGMHRYATDKEWIVPHFEKMLYDNAQIIGILAKVLMKKKNLFFSKKLNEVIDFLVNDLQSVEGGFFTAIDADLEGEEGKFYLWDYNELKEFLSEEEFNLLTKYYTITEEGNFNGSNILTLKEPLNDEIITSLEYQSLKNVLIKLNLKRNHRTHPLRDNKILTDLNSLLLSNLCLAYRATLSERIFNLAKSLGDFLVNNMIENKTIYHSYADGIKFIDGYAEDYFFLSDGLLSLYEITFDDKLLKLSYEIFNNGLESFYDRTNRVIYQQRIDTDSIIKTTDFYDNVLPSSTSMVIKLMQKFGKIFEDNGLVEESDVLLKKYFSISQDYPFGIGHVLSLVLNKVTSPVEIIFVEGEDNSRILELKKHFLPNYHSNQIIVFKGKDSNFNYNYLKDKVAIKSKTTVYFCRNFQCKLPVTEI